MTNEERQEMIKVTKLMIRFQKKLCEDCVKTKEMYKGWAFEAGEKLVKYEDKLKELTEIDTPYGVMTEQELEKGEEVIQ